MAGVEVERDQSLKLVPALASELPELVARRRHLLSLINDILDLSKIEAGHMELERADFDLPSAIENALILVRERASRRGVTLRHTLDERLGVIGGDERKVKQVLLNLLSNALKFTPEGGRWWGQIAHGRCLTAGRKTPAAVIWGERRTADVPLRVLWANKSECSRRPPDIAPRSAPQPPHVWFHLQSALSGSDHDVRRVLRTEGSPVPPDS